MVEGKKEEEANRVNHNHNNNKANNSNNKHFPGQVRGFLQCQNLDNNNSSKSGASPSLKRDPSASEAEKPGEREERGEEEHRGQHPP